MSVVEFIIYIFIFLVVFFAISRLQKFIMWIYSLFFNRTSDYSNNFRKW